MMLIGQVIFVRHIRLFLISSHQIQTVRMIHIILQRVSGELQRNLGDWAGKDYHLLL